MRKIVLSMALFGISCGAITQAKKIEGPLTYKEIGDQYISSFGAVQASVKQNNEESENSVLKPIEIDEFTRKKLAFEILANNDSADDMVGSGSYDSLRILLRELGIFRWQGEDAQQHLISKLNRVHTVFGEAALAKMLATPLTDSSILRKRQAFIKKLVLDDQLRKELVELMKKIKSVEPKLLSFWLEENQVAEKNFGRLYFGEKMTAVGDVICGNVNQSPVVLEAWTRLGNLHTVWQATSDFVMLTLCMYGMQKLAEKFGGLKQQAPWGAAAKVYFQFINPKAYWDDYKHCNSVEFETEAHAAYKQIGEKYGTQMLGSEEEWVARQKKHSHTALVVRGALGAALTAYKVSQIKTIAGYVRQERDALNYLQTNLIGVATVVDCAKQIHEKFMNNKDVVQGLMHNKAIETVFSSPEKLPIGFAQLVSLLQASTFKGEASCMSLSGRVLAAHKLMKEHKTLFAGLLQALGEIDACLSTALLVKDFEQERVKYSFVEYADATTPYINVQNFWNPFIDVAVVVPNSVEFGGTDKHIIVTGSNTGGKSTILKGIMLCQLLGQTLGVAPAESVVMTTNAMLLTAFNLSDDTVAGNSSFQAEVLRANELVKSAASLKPNEFGLFVIDELFKGTSADKGEAAAGEIVKRLSQFDNVIFIYATHYHNLTNLDCCQKYKVEAYLDANGAIARPFKLEKGVSVNNIADSLVEAALQA